MSGNNGWSSETPQEVIDEVEADLNAETDDYKQWLRKSINDLKAEETDSLLKGTPPARTDAGFGATSSDLSEEDG